MFTYVKDKMTISELQNAIGQEFGLCIPHNVILRCLSIVTEEKVLSFRNHQIYRVGDFDTKGFEDCRKEYRANEATLVEALIKYVEPFGKEWTFDFAREQLIKVLDRNGLAYEIFMNGHIVHDNGTPAPTDSHIDNLIPDDAEVEKIEDIESQPLYADSFYVGKFVEKLLGEGTTESEYLRKVCEGLMICVGAYQLPTTDKNSTVPQIKGTTFFFDTRLLLRSLGCAGTPAVNAVRELVKLIQDAGGIIAYYPHTLQEIYNAFDDALKKLEDNDVPHDDEMRIYAASVSNNIAVITAKKATVREELAKDNIWLRELETFSDSDRIHFGFDYNALKLFMRRRLQWDPRTIENDALSIWETHMRRKGN